ncbi:MAG: gliding motility-associated C-terminal domain-containing protein [Taibaiella sp.]|jgi:gliding motility-associated-like protein
MKFWFFLFSLSIHFCTAHAQLIINEFSQGPGGAQEYIELVVVGQRNCAGDSCVDIRGWMIDDNNGWYGAASGQGIAPGHIRFSNDANWSCVPYGSIILLYNLGDKNPAITMVDDPTDANNDNVYVLPSVSALIEGAVTTPISPSSLTYSYPSSTVYSPSPAWSAIGLANTGDAVIVIDPATPGAAHHSIAYGNLTSGASAVIQKATSGGSKNYYLTDDQYTLSASYNVGNAPADETPGAANNPTNATWINSMLTNVTGAVDNHIYTCIEQGNSYFFDGNTLTTAGIYIDTINTTLGCDSIIHLHLSVITPAIISGTISSCQPVTFNGITYTSSTVVNDTLHAALGCDSAYINMIIAIQAITTSEQWDTVSGCQSIVYKGVPYTTSQLITDTIKTPAGCDSVYKRVYLNIIPTPEINVPEDFTICEGASTTLTATSDLPVGWDGFGPGATINVSPVKKTKYIARVFNDLNCEGMAIVTVSVERLSLSLNASTIEAEIGLPVTFNVSSNQNFSVTGWQPESLFPNQYISLQTATFYKKGAVQITVSGKSEHDCVDTATLSINVLQAPDIFIPSAFSPNGDGMNDYFRPEFIREHAIKEFSIFNRWGQRVYGITYSQQLGKGWDGSYKGTKCEKGTYYYILSLQDPLGKEGVMKGDITLVN